MNPSNPYQSPRSSITPVAPTQLGQINILSAQGRLGRVRYIGYSVGLAILVTLLALGVGGATAFMQGGSEALGWLGGGVIILLSIAALALSVLLGIQRLHDFDASGWWSVLMIVPLANLLFYLILLIMPGTQGPNRFGNPPPPNTLGVTLIALVVPLIAVIGIIAAIAIPAYQNYVTRAQQTPPSSAQP